jgi:hypothetical protein
MTFRVNMFASPRNKVTNIRRSVAYRRVPCPDVTSLTTSDTQVLSTCRQCLILRVRLRISTYASKQLVLQHLHHNSLGERRFQSGTAEDSSVLSCYAQSVGTKSPMFRINLMFPFSGSNGPNPLFLSCVTLKT